MNREQQEDRPVAYDPEGRPLYYRADPILPVVTTADSAIAGPVAINTEPMAESVAKTTSHITNHPEQIDGHNFHPQLRAQYANEPRVVHAERPVEPKRFAISGELMQRYKASIARYPNLNLSPGECVLLDIKRHPIGMVIPIVVTVVLVALIFSFVSLLPSLNESGLGFMLPPMPVALIASLILSLAVVLGGATVLWVYLQNQFVMTNESVIQRVRDSIFSHKEQSVSLGSIEDASFHQAGFLQIMLNYGTIRLSTEGHDTTYVFYFVSDPKQQIATLNRAIEAFKNGRPVDIS